MESSGQSSGGSLVTLVTMVTGADSATSPELSLSTCGDSSTLAEEHLSPMTEAGGSLPPVADDRSSVTSAPGEQLPVEGGSLVAPPETHRTMSAPSLPTGRLSVR